MTGNLIPSALVRCVLNLRTLKDHEEFRDPNSRFMWLLPAHFRTSQKVALL